jgi:hypothetical protein
MVLKVDPVYIEPGFKIYYFDMIYSYPQILEIDLLIAFRGGLLSIELEKENLGDLSRKSLKYFLNGFTRYPVVYLYPSIDSKLLSNINILTPAIMDCSILKGEEILSKLRDPNLQQIWTAKVTERFKVFAIDNFLCSLLVYGAPAICESLLTDIFMKHLRSSTLTLHRVGMIRKVKRLGRLKGWENTSVRSQLTNNSGDLQVRSIITFIPRLENENLRKQIAKSLKNLIKEKSSLDEITVLYTEKSREHAEEIINELKTNLDTGINLTGIEVDKDSIAAKIKELNISKLDRDIMLLIIGEFPKRELLKLVDVIKSRPMECKLLMWRPKIQKTFEEIIRNVEHRCSLEEVEKLELVSLSV